MSADSYVGAVPVERRRADEDHAAADYSSLPAAAVSSRAPTS